MNTFLKNKSYINGKWVFGKEGKTFPVFNPANGKEIIQVADLGIEETKNAIQAAYAAFSSWSKTSLNERVKILKKWYQLTIDHIEELALLLSTEQGKPLHEAKEEIFDGALFIEWYAEEVKRVHGYTTIPPDRNRRFMTIRQPIGVVGVITPWNFPSAIPLQKCAPAIAAGCTVVLKPAEDTPLSALAHAELAHQAGIPPGVFNVITCLSPEEVGNELASNPIVRKLTFTGSTEVGKKLYQKSATTVKNICLELGGNSPVLIFDDANLELAVEKCIAFKFYNCGQCCNTLNRFLVHRSIQDLFLEKLEKKIRSSIKLGSFQEEATTMGPLINEQGVKKVEFLIQDATSKGGKLVLGGVKGKPGPLFFEPTILTQMDPSMKMFREEIFGPVIPIYPFSTDEEAIQIANDTEYGLAAYFFSENMGRTWRVAEALEAGSIGINSTEIFSELLPFGGWKQSGIGRENGAIHSLDAYYEIKSLIIGNCS